MFFILCSIKFGDRIILSKFLDAENLKRPSLACVLSNAELLARTILAN
jgi:hypothetical protein